MAVSCAPCEPKSTHLAHARALVTVVKLYRPLLQAVAKLCAAVVCALFQCVRFLLCCEIFCVLLKRGLGCVPFAVFVMCICSVQ